MIIYTDFTPPKLKILYENEFPVRENTHYVPKEDFGNKGSKDSTPSQAQAWEGEESTISD